MLIGDLLRVRRALDEARNAVHRTGAVEGDYSGDIFNALRLEAGTHAGHARAFKLEHADGTPGGKHVIGRLIVLGRVLYAEARLTAAHQLHRVVKHGEVAQAEEVHLEKAELLKRRHLVLAHDGFVVLRKRDIFVHRLLGYHNARRMGRGVARHTLESPCNVDEPLQGLVTVVHFLERL